MPRRDQDRHEPNHLALHAAGSSAHDRRVRHNGHADLLREDVDGETGESPPVCSGRRKVNYGELQTPRVSHNTRLSRPRYLRPGPCRNFWVVALQEDVSNTDRV
jgi:hypothetical protein